MLAETERDAKGSAGGTHDAVGSFAMEAPQDEHENGEDACAIVVSENVNAVQSAATVAELFVNGTNDLRGGKNDIGEDRTSKQDVGAAADEYRNSVAKEEDSMAAETQKETEEKLNGASDVKEVGYKAFLKDLKEAVEFQDHEEEVAGADTEEDCVEGKAAKYWKAAADGEVKYYKERD
ncbi:hypothetical protein MRX96_002330 [Rhipicephalus microplus]